MKKIICALLTLICIVTTTSFNVFATEVNLQSQLSENTQTNEISTRAYNIVWKYRIKDGKLEKRRWNQTRGVWVDSHWIRA